MHGTGALSGQASSPGVHAAALGHGWPAPDWAMSCVNARVQAAEHGSQVPSQLTSAGHAPSPGSQLSESPPAKPQAVPPLDAACVIA